MYRVNMTYNEIGKLREDLRLTRELFRYQVRTNDNPFLLDLLATKLASETYRLLKMEKGGI